MLGINSLPHYVQQFIINQAITDYKEQCKHKLAEKSREEACLLHSPPI